MVRLKRFKVLNFVYLIIFAGITLILIKIAVDKLNINSIFKNKKSNLNCKDWNDYEYIFRDHLRVGPGENGQKVVLSDPEEIALNKELYEKTGFSVVVSDKISVNRSIPDGRPQGCEELKYSANLPNVTVIIIFHNEVKSILLRTIHSVINRTPPSLLHEVILVNDNSSHAELYEPLQTYVRKNFHGKVKIKNLTERKGLIVTRLEGARIATGEVLVFFDSHIEVGYNWLPPLLDPIHRNRRLATMPVIDDYDPENFNVYTIPGYGDRASIDWYLIFRHFERYLPEGIDPLLPFPGPIMLGCAFAIDRKFFLDELGGYDEGFRIWNAENYELSFKLWLCADGLYEVPCSRVTHTFRTINPSRENQKEDFVARNFKRLAEVWMDEYKDVVYKYDEARYEKVDPGDLTKQKAIRERLNCKPFKYFMEQISPEILTRYPLVQETPVFASGQIKSLADENICIDTMSATEFDPISLYYCDELDDSGKPRQTQFFRLNFLKNIVYGYYEYCLDSHKMSMPQCTYTTYGNQIWKYDYKQKLLMNGRDEFDQCLSANLTGQSLNLTLCDGNDPNQKWEFTYLNLTALNDWDNIYGYQKFSYGEKYEMNREKMMPLEYERC